MNSAGRAKFTLPCAAACAPGLDAPLWLHNKGGCTLLCSETCSMREGPSGQQSPPSHALTQRAARYSVEAARRARIGTRTSPPGAACADASPCGIGVVRRKRLCGKAFLLRGADGACAVLGVQALAPTACTTIEEVGSTGVGALTLGFLALAVSTATSSHKSSSRGFI